MLTALHLRDFVLVEQAEIDFQTGFTVLSGETGAGKSVLLDAVSVAMGSRADAHMIRQGAPRAAITVWFRGNASIEAWLSEHDLSGDPGMVQLRRTIEADGRSRAFINGIPTTTTILRALSKQLLEIHGQHAAQTLLQKEGQRSLLDAYANLSEHTTQLSQKYHDWREAQRALDRARQDSQKEIANKEELLWKFEILNSLRPENEEWEAITSEHKRLANLATLYKEIQTSTEVLAETEPSIQKQLNSLVNKLQPLISIDENLGKASNLLDSAIIHIDEASDLLNTYIRNIDLDSSRYTQLDERMGNWFNTARKLRSKPEELSDMWRELQAQLSQMDVSVQSIETLHNKVREKEEDFQKIALLCSQKRKIAAEQLSQAAHKHLSELGMTESLLVVCSEDKPTNAGIDSIEFCIVSPHIGSQPQPLAKIASGGELSRISLVIAVLVAQGNPTATLIFDEADAGVGGATASTIGKLMHRLSQSRQVLCVTHSPQIAAQAHHHWRVSKIQKADGKVTSQLENLTMPERVKEIARMLGGVTITDTTLRHAEELLSETHQYERGITNN